MSLEAEMLAHIKAGVEHHNATCPMPARARSSIVSAIAAGTSQRGRLTISAAASTANGIQIRIEASGSTSTFSGVASGSFSIPEIVEVSSVQ